MEDIKLVTVDITYWVDKTPITNSRQFGYEEWADNFIQKEYETMSKNKHLKKFKIVKNGRVIYSKRPLIEVAWAKLYHFINGK